MGTKVRIVRVIRVLLAATVLGFCLVTAGCSAVEKKLEPIYQAILDDDSAPKNEQEKQPETKHQTTNEAIESSSEASEENTQEHEELLTAAMAATVTVGEVSSLSGAKRLPGDKKILLTGDSRTVCLYCSQIYDEAEYPKHVFYNIDEATFTGYTNESIVVAKGGEGCSWMRAVGIPNAFSHLDEADALVIWFGVNDLHVFADYINYVNGLVQQYDIPIYYMTIGPCNGKWEDKNSEVLAFNLALTQMLDPSVTIIDAYSYIKDGLDNGLFATMDGLHYDYNTSRAIYDYMVEQVENN